MLDDDEFVPIRFGKARLETIQKLYQDIGILKPLLDLDKKRVENASQRLIAACKELKEIEDLLRLSQPLNQKAT